LAPEQTSVLARIWVRRFVLLQKLLRLLNAAFEKPVYAGGSGFFKKDRYGTKKVNPSGSTPLEKGRILHHL
jgi:hypothetical protein